MKELHDLPEEVLLLIFDFLNIHDRKTASQVSRQWNRLTFTGRPMGTISLHLYNILDSTIVENLLNSNRRYRNLNLQLYHPFKIVPLMEVMDKFGKDLDSLTVDIYGLTVSRLMQLLEKTPNLKELVLGGDACNKERLPEMPCFNNIRMLQFKYNRFDAGFCKMIPTLFPSVISLDIDRTNHSVIDLIESYGNQLRCLRVYFDANELVVKFSTMKCLDNLEQLHVDLPQMTEQQLAIRSFGRMKLLKDASFSGPMNSTSFELLCNSCQHLETLCVDAYMISASSFSKITALKKLKALYLQWCSGDGNFLKDIQLPNVTHLKLQGTSSTEDCYNHLTSFVPNLQLLSIGYCNFENSHLQMVTKNLTKLRTLVLSDCEQITDEAFQYLDHLPNLVKLCCWSVPIKSDTFSRFPKCINMHMLSLDDSTTITDKTLLDIRNAFPNLAELHLVGRPDIEIEPEYTLDTLREVEKDFMVLKLQEPEMDEVVEKLWSKGWW